MPAKSAASPDNIEMSSVFLALRRALPKLLGISAVLGGLTFAVLAMMAPKYQSQAELEIVAKSTSGMASDPKSAPQGPDSLAIRVDKEAINTHVRALQSTDLLNKVAEDLKLAGKAEFNSKIGPVDMVDAMLRLAGLGGPRSGESERDRVLNALRNQIEVYSAKESRFIGIRTTATDPALAAEIANKLADAYRASLANQTVTEIDDQQKVMQSKIGRLTPEVASAETQVERYRGEINSFRGGTQATGLNDQQLSELTAELTRTSAIRGEAEARAKSAREMMKAGSADALPDVQKSPLIQNLVQQRVRLERQISELSASLLPGHPRMRQLQGDLAGLKVQLTGEIAKLVDSLDKEAKVSQGREDSIKKSLAELKSKVVTNAPEEANLRQLEASAKAKRTELESLQAQLEANSKKLDTRAQPVEARIMSQAQTPSVPVFPKKLPLAALVATASLLFGTAWTVTRALFAGARSGPHVHQREFGTRAVVGPRAEPVLTASAAVRESLRSRAEIPEPAAKTGTVASISALASHLKAKATGQGGHRTMVAGETSPVDASAEAIELAKALADGGQQVILVDWDPSGRGIASLAGAGGGKGLTELLLGEVTFEDAVKRVANSPVHFISCGTALDEAGADIEPDQLNLVLDALDEAYDYIVVVGRHDDARNLFEVIQGRFDAGVLVADEPKRVTVLKDPPGTYLGFEVTGVDVIRFERASTASVPNQRIQRVTSKSASEVRPI